MADEHIEATVVFGADNVNHLSAYWRYYGGPSALVIGSDGERTLVVMRDAVPIAHALSEGDDVLGYGERGFGINLDPMTDLVAVVAAVPAVARARRLGLAGPRMVEAGDDGDRRHCRPHFRLLGRLRRDARRRGACRGRSGPSDPPRHPQAVAERARSRRDRRRGVREHARTCAELLPGGELPHHGGYALGLTSFEDPDLFPSDTISFEPWMVLDVEPGVYFPGRYGARVENVFVVTPEGGAQLSDVLGVVA